MDRFLSFTPPCLTLLSILTRMSTINLTSMSKIRYMNLYGWHATIRRGRNAGGRAQDLLAERIYGDIDDRRGGSHGSSARQPLQCLWRQGAVVPARVRALRRPLSRFCKAGDVEPRSRGSADGLAQGDHRQL